MELINFNNLWYMVNLLPPILEMGHNCYHHNQPGSPSIYLTSTVLLLQSWMGHTSKSLSRYNWRVQDGFISKIQTKWFTISCTTTLFIGGKLIRFTKTNVLPIGNFMSTSHLYYLFNHHSLTIDILYPPQHQLIVSKCILRILNEGYQLFFSSVFRFFFFMKFFSFSWFSIF